MVQRAVVVRGALPFRHEFLERAWVDDLGSVDLELHAVLVDGSVETYSKRAWGGVVDGFHEGVRCRIHGLRDDAGRRL